MKILTFSTLYPNAVRPHHGIFIETRLRQLLAGGKAEARVVAPVPWFPSTHPRFGAYALHAGAPRSELRHGIRVLHPRYPLVPKVGMTLAPLLLAAAMEPVFERMLATYSFDVIDAHYFYPDGVAAVMLGRRFGKPVVVSARGTDLNVIARYRLPRRMIRWAASHAAGLVTVCEALKQRLIDLGVPAERVKVLRNGVDLRLFRPVDREATRRDLGFRRSTLLSVGNLVPLKGHDLTIRALAALPDCDLVIAGSGPGHDGLVALARDAGVADRVRFVGVVPQEELRRYYGAADALVLASSREGWANVLLEAMACGTPVIATDVGGSAEVVASPAAGLLVGERTPHALVEAVHALFTHYPDHLATRRYAEQFSWAATTAGQLDLFNDLLMAHRPCPAMRTVRAADAG